MTSSIHLRPYCIIKSVEITIIVMNNTLTVCITVHIFGDSPFVMQIVEDLRCGDSNTSDISSFCIIIGLDWTICIVGRMLIPLRCHMFNQIFYYFFTIYNSDGPITTVTIITETFYYIIVPYLFIRLYFFRGES